MCSCSSPQRLLLLALFAVSLSTTGQPDPHARVGASERQISMAKDVRDERLRARAAVLLAEHRVAGAAIVRIEGGAIAEAHHLGVRSSETAEPVTPDTLFQVASVSKPVAAWVVMHLVSLGRLDLDEPVVDRLTRWQIPESAFDVRGVTVRRLLSHTAGLSLSGYPGFRYGQPLPDLTAALNGASAGAGAVKLVQPPGQGFSYSGGGYTLLQLLVEEVTGETFADHAARTVLAPLGMAGASYDPNDAQRARLATPHGHQLDVIPHHHFRAQAAANLHASALDIARFALANLGDNPVLDRAVVQQMQRPLAQARPDMKIGLGFFQRGERDALIGHSGSNFGWKAQLSFVPESGDGLVVLTNSESGGRFTNDLLCFWDREYGASLVQSDCNERAASEAQTARRLELGTLLLMVAAALCVLGAVLVWWRGRFALFAQTWRWVLAFSLLLTAGLWWVLMYTPAAVWLIAGFWGLFPTIDYLAPGFRSLSLAVMVFLFAAALVCAFGPYPKDGIDAG